MLLEDGYYNLIDVEGTEILFTNETFFSDVLDDLLNIEYERAISFCESGKYDEALEIFENLGFYRDADAQIEMIKMCQNEYKIGEIYWNKKNYEMAYKTFGKIREYSNSEERFTEAAYYYAEELVNEGYYEKAEVILEDEYLSTAKFVEWDSLLKRATDHIAYVFYYDEDGNEYFPYIANEVMINNVSLVKGQEDYDQVYNTYKAQAEAADMTLEQLSKSLRTYYKEGEDILVYPTPAKEGYNGVWVLGEKTEDGLKKIEGEVPATMGRKSITLIPEYIIGTYTMKIVDNGLPTGDEETSGEDNVIFEVAGEYGTEIDYSTLPALPEVDDYYVFYSSNVNDQALSSIINIALPKTIPSYNVTVYVNYSKYGPNVSAIKEGVYMYMEPDKEAMRVIVAMNSVFKLISESDEWLKVMNTTNNTTGYVLHDEFEVVAVSEPEAMPMSKPITDATNEPVFNDVSEDRYVHAVKENAGVYLKPDRNARRVTVSMGSMYKLVSESDEWLKILNIANNASGFVLWEEFEVVAVSEPEVTPTIEPTPEPTVEPTPEPYDEKWVENREAVALFQDQLIRLGWLSAESIDNYGELDASTYDAIFEIQRTFLQEGTYIPVYNEDGTVNSIDEVTYNFIMNELKKH